MRAFISKENFKSLLLRYALFLLAAGAVIAGCKDNPTSLGAQYFIDTVGIHTTIRSDTGFLHFTDTLRPFVSTAVGNMTLTDSTTLVLIGKVSSANENLESWGCFQFPPLTTDTIAMVTGVRLLLKDFPFKYGDTTSSHVNFQVWTSYNKITDSTTSISQSDLSPSAIGTIDTILPDTTDNVLPLVLDSSATKAILNESNNVFIVTPGATMTNVRAFGSLHNYINDSKSVPQLQIILHDTDTIYKNSTLSFHLVHDNSLTPAGEFTLRASVGKRERINMNLAHLVDSNVLDQFSSVNNATLVLHMDPNNTRLPRFQGDTIGPNIILLGSSDSADHPEGNGYRDLSDPTGMTYRFQVRGLVEYWLRNPSLNLGLELRSEFAVHTMGGESIGVEDNTLSRWTFYGPNCSDPALRPYLILSYSKLR